MSNLEDLEKNLREEALCILNKCGIIENDYPTLRCDFVKNYISNQLWYYKTFDLVKPFSFYNNINKTWKHNE